MRNPEPTPPEGLRLRPMRAEDAPAAARLALECFPGGEAWSEAGFRSEAEQPHARPFCAFLADGLVGFLCGIEVCGEATLNLIAVAPAFRGRGVAARLMEAFLAALPGDARVSLEVRESNAPALALYRRFGFEPAGRRRGFYHTPAEDALVLVREQASGGGGDRLGCKPE